ncbi:proline-rich protein PRCC [Parasteatoda tepidariorum]|nr:proline-rich protein PRCC [Parasteatoda tepidariorum]
MSLVAYASSDDDSQSEKEDEISTEASLPKKREPVKISIPSLKEFQEEDKPDPIVKPKPKGGSGLFSILPPPKNSSTFSKPGFTPYVFSKKKESKPTPQKRKQITPTVLNKTQKLERTEEIENSVDEIDDDSSEKMDFFSLNTETTSGDTFLKKYEIELNENFVVPTLNTDSSISQESSIKVTTSENYPVSHSASSASWNENYGFSETSVPETSSSTIDWSSLEMRNASGPSESDGSPDLLKDEQFMKLKGRKEMENINIIDVSADDQLTGKDQWIMQSLTEETYRPLKRRHDMPTSQQKRKHQITYLAYQAKERELDLKNQWALNNRTRRETQAKYGF